VDGNRMFALAQGLGVAKSWHDVTAALTFLAPDMLLENPAFGTRVRGLGTTVRFYDDELKTWRVTWVSPMQQAVRLLEGGHENGSIVLPAQTPRGRLRCTFSDITDQDFTWRGERSVDEGKTWQPREDHRMRGVSRA